MGLRDFQIAECTLAPVPDTSDLAFEEMSGGQSCTNARANTLIKMQQTRIDGIVHRRAVGIEKNVAEGRGAQTLEFECKKSNFVKRVDGSQPL